MTVIQDVAAEGLGASLFDASEDCVKVVGLDGALLAMNANGICLMEIDDFEALKGRRWSSLWPEPHQGLIEEAVAAAREGRASRFFADCPTAKGSLRSWDVTVAPVMGADGAPLRMVSISRDVTERMRMEEQNELLVRELAHRIKNMFAVVDGVISLSARNAPDSKPFADGLRSRLLGLGRAIAYVAPPELIGRDDSTEYTLHGLLQVLLGPYGLEGPDQRVTVEGDDVPVGRTATTSVALFAHELATNALKYGALGADNGLVCITTRRTPGEVEILWEEHGSGVPAAKALEAEDGFGTTLLDNAVVRQLGGRISRSWGNGGLVVTVHLPTTRLGF